MVHLPYIWHKSKVNAGKYTSPGDPMGYIWGLVDAQQSQERTYQAVNVYGQLLIRSALVPIQTGRGKRPKR